MKVFMREVNWELYRKLYLIRRAENEIRDHYLEDQMKTPMHMSTGEEAIATGVVQALDLEDQVLGTYRSHGLYLAKTLETDLFFAEMYGKDSGMARGKGGSMHLSSREYGLICTSAIVATPLPVAVGAAFANQQQGLNRKVAVFFGDGAIDEGVFWESVNAACLWHLPVIFVCEDNGFAVHSPARDRHGYNSIADIIERFQCRVFRSETTDAEEIYELTRQALMAMDEEQSPVFLHLQYYRYLEHVGVFEDFKAGYRDLATYEEWRKRDPVDLQRTKLTRIYSEEEVRKLECEIDEQVERSRRFAEEAPYPEPDVLFEDLLV
jgi:acetoin:2,6-dichlorophenolindophenol oxidoreductase subunit alpha